MVGNGSEAGGNWERGWWELGARLVGIGSEASGNCMEAKLLGTGGKGGWFSMSPLPRLHHHDIMTIVGLFTYCQYVIYIYIPFVRCVMLVR